MLDQKVQNEQYSLGRILAIWLAAAVPMGSMLWVVMPLVKDRVDLAPELLYFCLATGGLVWQGVLCLGILLHEVRPFTWAGVKERLWLNAPLRPSDGRPSWRLLWWTVPALLFTGLWDALGVLEFLNRWLLEALPFLEPPHYGLIQNLAGPARGQWWLMGVLAVLVVFNYFLGEELLFRGILLPRMNGVFGRYDWVANGILFSGYHFHLIWGVPSQIILRDWVFPLVSKRFRSYWPSVVVHGFEGLVVIVLFPLAITGQVT